MGGNQPYNSTECHLWFACHDCPIHPEVPDAFFHSLRSLPTGFQCSDQLSSCREVASVVKFLGEQKSGEVYEMG